MLASLHPTSPPPDQAVKDLLDHRARASHIRYTSVSFSERSDSPSIYSRGDCSPGALYAPKGELHTRSDHPMSVLGNGEGNLPPSATSSFGYDDDQTSLVDDDDDVASFISAPTPRPAFHRGPDPAGALDSELESPPRAEEGQEDSRMSMLGPKMRFVSRAPWEMGEDNMVEEEEEDTVSTPDGLSIFGGKMGGWRGRDQDKISIKGLGLATFRSRSPGPPPATTKKGGIGMNFGLSRRKTPEPRGESPYGPYLTGASQSHNAVITTLASSSGSSHSVTDSRSSDSASRPSFSQIRREPTSPISSAFPPLPLPNAHIFRMQNASSSSHDDSASSSLRSISPTLATRFVHPYANPDVIPNSAPPPSAPLPRTPGTSRDQANEDRDGRGLWSRRGPESPVSSPHPTTLRKTSAGGLPFPVPPSQSIDAEDDEEDIHPFTSPRARVSSSTTPSSPVRSMMTYRDQPGSPMHNLISLEQARARVQHAPQTSSRTQHDGNMAKSNPTSTLVAGLGLAPGVVENGVIRGQLPRPTPPVPLPHHDSPRGPAVPPQSSHPQQRQRTISSGKHMFGGGAGSSGPDGDAVPVKALKHKKSAFMKLFQGGKDKEREREQQKGSLSSSPTSPVRAMSTPPQTSSSDASVPPLPGLHNIKRVPPPLSVVVTSPSTLASDSLPRVVQDSRPPSPPRHRQASSPLPSSANHGPTESSIQLPWQPPSEHALLSRPAMPAASAPPTQTSFTTLSLRPVSTIFSAKFPDLLNPSSSPPPHDSSATFTTRPSYPSPTTPGFGYSRSNSISTASDYPITPTSSVPLPGPSTIEAIAGEDQTAVIIALQEQILNSRKAWQRQIWELEGQVKDLKTEVEELRNTGDCETCGKAKREGRIRAPIPHNGSIVDRPRPRMGGSTRSVFGGGSDA